MWRPSRGAFPVKGGLLAVALLLPDVAASAEPAQNVQQVAELRELQALDQRVADIGWRLATANLALCPQQVVATGITLHTASQYVQAYRGAAQAAFGLVGDDPGVLSVAQGSPAWEAGIRPGDRLVAIDGVPFTPATAPDAKQGSYVATDSAMQRLETIPAGQRPVISLIRDGAAREVVLAPVAACASRFELATGNAFNANSNGTVVQVFGRLVTALPREDLALVIAHELAHNVLGHNQAIRDRKLPKGLAALFGSGGRARRDFERVADRYGIYMTARAGFAYADAPGFWRDLAASGGLGAWIAATHPTPGNREKNAAAVVAEIARLQAAGEPLVPPAADP